jgi:hypothetical protein
MFTYQFQTTFAQGGGGVKSVCRRGCEWQGGRLLSQLGSRIRPLFLLISFHRLVTLSLFIFYTVRVSLFVLQFFSFIDTQRGIRTCLK